MRPRRFQYGWGERKMKDGSRLYWRWDADGRHADLFLLRDRMQPPDPGYWMNEAGEWVPRSWDQQPPVYRRITRRQAKGALKIPTLKPYLHERDPARDRCLRCGASGIFLHTERTYPCLVPHR